MSIAGQTVAIVQSWLTPYRLPFYEALRDLLARDCVQLKVFYGQASPSEAMKRDHVDLDWGTFVPNRYLSLLGREVSWQPCYRKASEANLVIVEQAVKRGLNWLFAIRRSSSQYKLGLWGHGRNFQSPSDRTLAESSKAVLSRQADWWFAYTARSAAIVEKLPFPSERITVVNNSIDTRALANARDSVRASFGEIEALRATTGIRSTHVGLYVGAMYEEKRLGFLVQACDRVRQLVPDFEMILIGSGSHSTIVKVAARSRPWMYHVESIFGPGLAPYFEIASVLLMPGLVGLTILDSFVFETPIVTTDVPYHSPEIDYLREGENGIRVRGLDDIDAYSSAVATLLLDSGHRERLIRGCKESAAEYSIERMAQNFADGIKKALAIDPRSTTNVFCRRAEAR